MSIRLKFILVVLPLLVVGLVFGGVSSFYVASNSITRLAIEFFGFKVTELENYIDGQWRLLVENGLDDRDDMKQAAQVGIEVFARSILRSESEVIFAVNSAGDVTMSTAGSRISDPSAPFDIPDDEAQALVKRMQLGDRSLIETTIDGGQRVTMGFAFEPFDWYIVLSEDRDVFYKDIGTITTQTIILVASGVVIMAILLLVFVGFITRPLSHVVVAMKNIIQENDLSSKVPVLFNDEIGQMTNTFNLMTDELSAAYGRIKKYAFDAVLSQKKEARIRNIFQKYVPQQLIDQFFQNPEGMLVGENRVLAVLFSDIRSFTTISEAMRPDDLVNALNRYFSKMVDIIMEHGGIIDKYIGDAIMAFFGAPVKYENDALNAISAALDMMDALDTFNAAQLAAGKPEFKTGIGINYGEVTVGNIGSERKMDYTVIGDPVNLASRLEGQSKPYHQPLIISEFLYERVKDTFPCRFLDLIAVKGKTKGVRIYTARKKLSDAETKGWSLSDKAMDVYYSQDFRAAEKMFREANETLGGDDFICISMIERAKRYAANPPPPNWDGVEVLTEK